MLNRIGLYQNEKQEWTWIDTGSQVDWLPPGFALPMGDSPRCLAMDASGSWQEAPCNTALHSICKAKTG